MLLASNWKLKSVCRFVVCCFLGLFLCIGTNACTSTSTNQSTIQQPNSTELVPEMDKKFLSLVESREELQKYVEKKIFKEIKLRDKPSLFQLDTLDNNTTVFEVKTDGKLPAVVKVFRLGLPDEALFFLVVSNGSELIVTGCVYVLLEYPKDATTPIAQVKFLDLDYSWKFQNRELQVYAVNSEGEKFFQLSGNLNPASNKEDKGGALYPIDAKEGSKPETNKIDLTPSLEVVPK